MDNENGNLTCNYDCNCNLCETISSLVAKGIEESQLKHNLKQFNSYTEEMP